MSDDEERMTMSYAGCSQYIQKDILSGEKRGVMLQNLILTRFQTIKKFAEFIGKKKDTVDRWIAGRNFPNIQDILAICFMFEIPIDNFVRSFPAYSYSDWQEKIENESDKFETFRMLYCNRSNDVKAFFSTEMIDLLFFEFGRYLLFGDLSKIIPLIGDEIDLFYFCEKILRCETDEYQVIVWEEIESVEKKEWFSYDAEKYYKCRNDLWMKNSTLYFGDSRSRMEGTISERRFEEAKKYFRKKGNEGECLLHKKKTGKCIDRAIRFQYGNLLHFEEITGYREETVKKWTLAQSMPTRWEWEDLRRMLDLPLCNLMRFTREDMIDLAIEDVCVLIPFVELKFFWCLSICGNKVYIFRYLRNEVIEQIKDTPAGKYALRKLKRRICPLVDDIDIKPFLEDEEMSFQEWEAYQNAWIYSDVDIWLTSKKTLNDKPLN